MHCNILEINKYAFGRFVLKCTAYSPNVPHIGERDALPS